VRATAGGFRPWLPWIAGIVVVGAISGGAAAFGAFGAPAPAKASSAIVLGTGVDALDCPGGAPVAEFVGGERVLVLERSDDSHYLQVRNPYDISQKVWVSTGLVSLDKKQPAISTLPVGDCPKPNLALDAVPVAPVVVAPPVPTKGGGTVAPPAPPKETVKPVIVKASANPTTILNDQATTLSVVATDNVGVTGVTATWSGAVSGSGTLHLVSGTWQLSFSSTRTDGPSYGTIVFVFTAHDAAGNASPQASATVDRQYFG
jgi:hypothetical protein